MEKILDHGYIKLVESHGSDEMIIESARMSTARGFEGWGPVHQDDCQLGLGAEHCDCTPGPGDEKLLRYLWENRHTTPFEMAGATLEVKAPIFIFREWHRHRTQSYSEMSSRYVPLPNEDYVPTLERVLGLRKIRECVVHGDRQTPTGSCTCPPLSGATRQATRAAGSELLTDDNARRWIARLRAHYAETQELYELGLRIGVPKELARLPLPVARYSVMRASANLLNWTRFLSLRLPENAQWEIRAYAGAAAEILSDCFPRTMALFGEGMLRAVQRDKEIAK